jgi:predicted O-methyltransferase YrrM
MSELKPTYGSNFLLAFDYQPSALQEEGIPHILFIHSTQLNQSRKMFARLRDLYPKSNFSLLKNVSTNFLETDFPGKLEIINYSSSILPLDFHATDLGQKLVDDNIDMVFFGLNLDARPEVNPLDNSFAGRYDNIFNFIIDSGLYNRSYAIDNQFAVYPTKHLEHLWRGERFTLTWDICGNKLPLPWTLISLQEKEALFQLAQSGSGEGAIVNIGNFLGGSSIILAKASKLGHREKVFSFDLDSYSFSSEMYKINDVEDWIIFERKNSLVAAGEWKCQKEQAIRLLFIDGDHSYEGCKNDILAWVPYLVPGGILAIHDYGNVSQGAKYSSIVNAVFDTVLTDTDFTDFRRVDTLFLATRKNT